MLHLLQLLVMGFMLGIMLRMAWDDTFKNKVNEKDNRSRNAPVR